MSFWLRYGFLILLCVVTPMAAAFWLDTNSQIERATAAGEATASTADPALGAQLTLSAHRRVGEALQIAQAMSDEKLLAVPRATFKPEALSRMSDILARDGARTGFAWLIDDTGMVVARHGTARPVDPDRLTGHPLYVSTQMGYALDGLLKLGDALFMVAVAPVTTSGEAKGAVFLATPIDREALDQLKSAIRADVTLVIGDEVVWSTLPTEVAVNVVGFLGKQPGSTPLIGGRFATPLSAGMLPLFVAKDGSGIGFASVSSPMVGGDGVRWVISVPNAPALATLADRQQVVLAVFVCAFLAAIVIGLSISRTYVRPLNVLSEHLSGLQQGRGEREISEKQVSGPFRRLAKLINMTVQKIPPGGAFAFSEADRRGSLDPGGDLGSAMMGSNPPPPMTAAQAASAYPGSQATGAAPLNASSLSSISNRPVSGAAVARADAGAMRTEGSGSFSRLEHSSTVSAPPAPAPAPTASRTPSAASSRVSTEPQFAGADLDAALGVGLDSALAEAARAVGADSSPPGPKKAKSAASIRGASASMLDVSASTLQAVGGSARPSGGDTASRAPVSAPPAANGNDSPFMGLLDDVKAPAPSNQFAMPSAPSGARSGGSAAFGFGSAGVPEEEDAHSDDFRSEATVVAATPDYLLQASARDMTSGGYQAKGHGNPDHTVVAEVPKDLLAESKKSGEIDDPEDMAHFKETYEHFVDMRKQCGEATNDLVFERFLVKLRKNREGLMSKYQCKTVRFQVYEKDGKAALKATPVR